MKAWQAKALSATRGTKLGAILACVLNEVHDTAPTAPRFIGKASVTSDGFVMCAFIDRAGRCHHGALVGAVCELDANVAGLAEHLALKPAERVALRDSVTRWIEVDYRSGKR